MRTPLPAALRDILSAFGVCFAKPDVPEHRLLCLANRHLTAEGPYVLSEPHHDFRTDLKGCSWGERVRKGTTFLTGVFIRSPLVPITGLVRTLSGTLDPLCTYQPLSCLWAMCPCTWRDEITRGSAVQKGIAFSPRECIYLLPNILGNKKMPMIQIFSSPQYCNVFFLKGIPVLL